MVDRVDVYDRDDKVQGKLAAPGDRDLHLHTQDLLGPISAFLNSCADLTANRKC